MTTRRFWIALLPLAFAFGPAAAQDSSATVAEYCRRAREVSPADADAQHRLGVWAKEQGLTDAAERAFRLAISIDGDHEGARAELGYVRYGTGWILREALARLATAPEPSAARSSAADPSSVASSSSTSAAASRSPAPRAGSAGVSSSGEAASEATEVKSPEESAEEAIAKKKAWAEEAAKKLQTEFQTHEDDDFLIHTTYDSPRHARVQLLLKTLRAGKQIISRLIGTRSGIWPHKVQFVLLRSQPEFARFAAAVDEVRDLAAAEGAYTAQRGHTVLWQPTSVVPVARIAEAALERSRKSDPYVGWWLREGVAELTMAHYLAKLDVPETQDYYQKSLLYAAEAVEGDPQASSIYSIVETQGYRRRERERKRALAMSLVDYLVRKSGRGLHKVIEGLRSEEAPPPPTTESKEEVDAFYISYVSFQQEKLESSFRSTVEKLGEDWTAYVLKRGEAIREASQAEGRDTRNGDGRGGRGG